MNEKIYNDLNYQLIDACHCEREDKILELLDKKAYVNYITEERYTPLMLSSMRANENITKLLLENRANINQRNRHGWTAFDYCSYQNKTNIMKLLIDNKSNIDNQDSDGNTNLHHVCIANNVNSIKFLILNGADVNIQNKEGELAHGLCKDDIAKKIFMDALEELAEKYTKRPKSSV